MGTGTTEATRASRAGGLPRGTQLGRYELLGLLSVGGMAEIYLARTAGIAGFERLVVVKRMLPHFAMQPDFVEMFLAEARLGARLDHPNVVAVHDIGEETGSYYYAMEYVRGSDLRHMMIEQARIGPMPVDAVVAIGLGMCLGLDHAHELTDDDGHPYGVVHRDVSLANVLVSYDGTVKVTDFGVAKLASTDRTQTGTLKGKIGYMSPEHCRGQALDRRSDIFAIGIVLYELSTGQRLFGSERGDFAILEQIVHHDVAPPSSRVPGYPAELEAIVCRALQRDRERRYQTAREMHRDLERLARAHQLHVAATDLAAYLRTLMPPGEVSEVRAARERARSTTEIPARARSPESLAPATSAGAALGPAGAQVAVEPAPEYESIVLAGGPTRVQHFFHGPHRRGAMVGLAALVAVIAGVLIAMQRGDDKPMPTSPVRGAPMVFVASVDARTEPAGVVALPDEVETLLADEARSAGARAPREATDPSVAGHLTDVDGTVDEARAAERPRALEAPRARKERRRATLRVHVEPDAGPVQVQAPPEATPLPSAPIAAAPIAPPVAPPARPAIAAAPPARSALAPAIRTAPGSLDAVPTIAGVDVQGPLQDSEILRAVDRGRDALRDCYRAAARAAGKTPPVTIQLHFQIDETRAARDVSVGRADLPGLSACLRQAAGRFRTRIAPDVGNAQVSLTVTFAPTRP